jgi:hypothetical protein
MKSLVAPRPAKIQQSKDDGRARTKPQHRRRLRPRLDRDGRSVSVIASATAATAAGALFHVPACAYPPCFQLEISDAAVTVGNMA